MDNRLARTREGDYCPVRASLALLGQRWVPRIVYELRGGRLRFNDLALTVGGCNSRTLRDRLRDLEVLELVTRHEVAAAPPWVEYELTERGRELADALNPLASWGRRHLAVAPPMAAGRSGDASAGAE